MVISPNKEPDNIELGYEDDEIVYLGDAATFQGLDEHYSGPSFSTRRNVDDDDDSRLPENRSTANTGLTAEESARLLKLNGLNQLPLKRQPSKWLVVLQLLIIHPTSLLSWIAIIIEGFIGNWAVLGILTFLYLVHACIIVFIHTEKIIDPLASLKSILGDGKLNVTVKRYGRWITIHSSLLVPGDIIQLVLPSVVPADCRIVSGEIEVNQAAITGEAYPVTLYKNDICLAGSSVSQGEAEAIVESTGTNTVIGKIDTYLRNDMHYDNNRGAILSTYHTLIMTFFVIAFVLCAAHFLYIYFDTDYNTRRSAALTAVLIVASVPFTMTLVTYSIYSVGCQAFDHHAGGIIIRNYRAIDSLARISVLCLDMTGHFTLNQALLQEDGPVYIQGETEATVLVYASLTCKPYSHQNTIDDEILKRVDKTSLEHFETLEYHSWNPMMKCSECTVVDTRTGVKWNVRKGDPHVLVSLLHPTVQLNIIEAVQKDVDRLEESGLTVVAVARAIANTGDWEIIGLLSFLDPPNVDITPSITTARSLGLQVKMFTKHSSFIMTNVTESLYFGRCIFNAESITPRFNNNNLTASSLNSDREIERSLSIVKDISTADGFSDVSPEHKYSIIDVLCKNGFTVGSTGANIFDLFSLKRAHLRIATVEASDHVRDIADVVLKKPGLSDLISSIVIARKVFTCITNFITFRFSTSCQILFFLFIATFAFEPSNYAQPSDSELSGEPWPQFFQMPVLLILIIYLLNDCVLAVTLGYSYQEAKTTPCRWNTRDIALNFILGVVPLASTLLVLQILLNSWEPSSLWIELGLTSLQYGEIISAMYLKLSLSQIFALVSTCSGREWFWCVWPGRTLFIGIMIVMVSSSVLGLFFPSTKPEGIEVMGLVHNPGVFGFIWIWSLLIFLFQDALKVMLSTEIISCGKQGKCRRAFSLTTISSSSSQVPRPSEAKPLSVPTKKPTKAPPNREEVIIEEPVVIKETPATKGGKSSTNSRPIPRKGDVENIEEPFLPKDPPDEIISGRRLIERYKNDKLCVPVQIPLLYLEACTNMFNSRRVTAGKSGFGLVYDARDYSANFGFLVQQWISSFQLDDMKHLPLYRHPNIVPKIGYSLDQKREKEKCYIIYDSKAQESLCQLLMKGKTRKGLTAIRRVEIMYDICLALNYLHRSKEESSNILFHGDIKSDSIILASDGTAMLMGCGLSNIALHSRPFQEGEQLLGSPGYVCPWYCQGGKRFRSECDVYSFGMVMIELVTGNVYPGFQVDRYLLANDGVAILMDDADRDAGTGWLHVLEELCLLCLSCIDPNPVRRPSADAIRTSLSRIIGKMDA